MFALQLRHARLTITARLLAFRISLLGLKVWARETTYHALTRYTYRTGMVAFGTEPDDDDIQARIDAAVEEATSGLKANNKKLLADLKKAKQGGEIDPADVERLESELETLKTQLTEANRSLKTATTAAEKATNDLKAEQAHTERLLITNGLAEALGAAGVKDPMLLKSAAAMLRDDHKPVVTADGEKRVAMIGDKPLADFVKGWALGDEGKSFVAAADNNGGGAQGSGKTTPPNPFAKDTFSLTEQGKLFNENPTQAKALAAAAGVTLE